MTLPRQTAEAVVRKRASGASIRGVAHAIGVAKSTVQRILDGCSPHDTLAAEVLEPDPDPDYPGKPFRCGGCGALISGLCVQCNLPPFTPAASACDDGELALDLAPPERARYEAVRAAKDACAEAERIAQELCAEAEREAYLDALDEPTDEELAEIERELR